MKVQALSKYRCLNKWLGIILSLSLLVSTACTWEQIDPIKIPKPKVPVATNFLEASYVTNSPNTLKANYWKTADYRSITVRNLVINKVNTEDGALNMNGTFNGMTDFNGGDSVKLILKAAYDDQNLYILASWMDKSFNLSQNSFLFNGPPDVVSGADSAGWTGQRSDDNIIFSFENGGEKDIWKWSFALSEPLGYAIDMLDNGTLAVDNGDVLFVPNDNGGGLRSGPKYEWDGQQQELVRELGGFTILDPGFYLLNKTPFTGDVVRGDSLFLEKCAKCHGVLGDGNGYEWETGVALDIPGFYNRISRGSFEALLAANSHSGKTYWESLTAVDKEDMVARIRGFAGVPGYYLDNTTGSFPDVLAVSNVSLGKVNTVKSNDAGYQVLFVRKLNTTHNDDLQFDPALGDYAFNIYLSDNDNLNMIGAENEKLIFK